MYPLLVCAIAVGLTACGDDEPCTGHCGSNQQIARPADGTLTFDDNGSQKSRELGAITPSSAGLANSVVTLACEQDGESFTLKFPSSAVVGAHDLKAGTGYDFAVVEQSADVPGDLRGDYAVSDASAPRYGTLTLTDFSLDRTTGHVDGTLDATLPGSSNPAIAVHAHINIHSTIAVPLQ